MDKNLGGIFRSGSTYLVEIEQTSILTVERVCARVAGAVRRVRTVPPVRPLQTFDVLEMLYNQRAATHDAEHELCPGGSLVRAYRQQAFRYVSRAIRGNTTIPPYYLLLDQNGMSLGSHAPVSRGHMLIESGAKVHFPCS